ncbi:helix-turn-helix domain-containing protein [Flavobacterium soli]|uniref:helix-turn-helix domain-containing protein n=1 Tax=Flavobacterium soli TaxID=344881 RepID=UPI000688503C|nr:helix-turn-helix domain-containing protein [Flavobacterium soli]
MIKQLPLFIAILLSLNAAGQANAVHKKMFDTAKAYAMAGDMRKAEMAANGLLERSLKEDNDEYTARSYFLLGYIKYYDSRYYLSNEYYAKALKSNFSRKDIQFAEACYNNRGSNFDYLNQLPEAIQEYHASLKIAERRGDSTSIGQTWINIALLDARAKRYEAAESRTRQMLSYFGRKGDTVNMALCYQNLALFYKDQVESQNSLGSGYKALQLYKGSNNQYGAVNTLYTIAEAYHQLGRIAESNTALAEALRISLGANMEMEGITSYIYLHLAKNDIRKGRFESVDGYLEKAHGLISSSGVSNAMDEYYVVRGQYYARIGDFDAYMQNQEAYLEYAEQMEISSSTATYRELETLYGFERKEAQIRQQRLEITGKDRQMWVLVILLAFIIVASLIITYYYFRMRSYVRKLYRASSEDVRDAIFTPVEEDATNKLANLYNNILPLMESGLYLKPGLNIADLSKILGTNDKYISQAINSYSNSNFNIFLNRYRVGHAKKMFIEKGSKVPVKVVSMESGFSSYATFYKQFKDLTGLTPSQFMEMSEENLKKDNHF